MKVSQTLGWVEQTLINAPLALPLGGARWCLIMMMMQLQFLFTFQMTFNQVVILQTHAEVYHLMEGRPAIRVGSFYLKHNIYLRI